ncbi:MAG: hypothetical protein WD766_00265, partial [Gemmatimonadota bacterium]
KRFPREGKIVKTAEGPEKVIGIDIWHDQVTLLSESRERRVVELESLRAEMSALQEAELSGSPAAGAGEQGDGRNKRRGRSRHRNENATDGPEAAATD